MAPRRPPARNFRAADGKWIRISPLWVALWVGPALAQSPDYSFSAGPQFRAIGFGDIGYLESDGSGDEGFLLGQAVGHLIGELDERLHLFAEMSATARSDKYDFEVERLILRYDFSDRLKLSGGRYHTPLGYWNSAFHHGAWLQTTASRPEVVRFGSPIVPIHFVGVQLEGRLFDYSLGYRIGVGNGRHSNIARAGDAGDINSERAWTVSAFGSPLPSMQIGASAYFDKVTPDLGSEIDEQIYSAYAVWESERPEVILEYHHFEHDEVAGPAEGSGDGAYLQVAYRLRDSAHPFKPYARLEYTDIEDSDPLLGARGLDYEAGILGVRWDFSHSAALKAEYRSTEFDDAGRDDGIFIQVAFVVAPGSAGLSFGAQSAPLPRTVAMTGRMLQ